MAEATLRPGSGPPRRSTLPLTVPLALAAAAWAVALFADTSRLHPRPQVWSGSVSELAPEIEAAPRAVVYVCPMLSHYAMAGRPVFLEAAGRVARERPGPGVRFFVVEYWVYSDSGWVGSLRGDDRLVRGLGYSKNGWVMWLESGRVRETYFYTNTGFYTPGLPMLDVEGTVERTRSLWPR